MDLMDLTIYIVANLFKGCGWWNPSIQVVIFLRILFIWLQTVPPKESGLVSVSRVYEAGFSRHFQRINGYMTWKNSSPEIEPKKQHFAIIMLLCNSTLFSWGTDKDCFVPCSIAWFELPELHQNYQLQKRFGQQQPRGIASLQGVTVELFTSGDPLPPDHYYFKDPTETMLVRHFMNFHSQGWTWIYLKPPLSIFHISETSTKKWKQILGRWQKKHGLKHILSATFRSQHRSWSPKKWPDSRSSSLRFGASKARS